MALANVPAAAQAGPSSSAGIIFPAAAPLGLRSGEVVEARVMQRLGGDAVRLQIQGVLIDALAGVKLAQGARLQVRVEGQGAALRLAILSGATGQPAQPAQAAQAPQVAQPGQMAQPGQVAQPAVSPPPPGVAPGAGAMQSPGSSVEAAMQRLLGDVLRGLTGPTATVSDSQRQAAARILDLAAPAQGTGGPPPQSLAAKLPAGAMAQLVSNLAQVIAREPGAGEMVRQAAARLFALPQAGTQPASPGAVPGQGLFSPASIPSMAPAGALKALDASATLLLAGKPDAVPAPVRAALERVVALRLPVTAAVTGETLQRAVGRSGVFLEAHLAQGGGGASAPVAAGQVAGDMKVALFLLRDAVRGWLGDGEARAQGQGTERATQTARGEAPQAARAEPAAGAARDMARVLLAQTDAALARMRVAQVAALPDRVDHPGATANTDQNGQLNVMLPLTHGDRPGFLQMQVERDGTGGEAEDGAGGWRVRFALDVEPAGPAQAVVGLKAGEVSVSLWAERGETAALLAAQEPLLRGLLEQAGLAAGAIAIRRGKPSAQIWRGAHYLDRRS